jgi:hypothetical protein
VKPGDSRIAPASISLQMPACGNFGVLVNWNGAILCTLRFGLVVVDPVFISSHYVLQKASLSVSYRRKSGYACSQRIFFLHETIFTTLDSKKN